ncbi:hypothetical protein HHI36_005060 [Cryptolaemus montrouzieri]|uniref:Uncharacterized protein n=1 Tax=Cryptolaemus montrouzieri TaxID=559131 RepID=A0ABD2NUK9_9CUCU
MGGEELTTRRLNSTPTSKSTTSRKRNTPPFGKCCEKVVSYREKINFRNMQKKYRRTQTSFFNEISDAVGKHAELSEGSIPQIKTWIHNQITKMKKIE